MPATALGFRYPLSTDTPDVVRDIRYLAEDVDELGFYNDGANVTRLIHALRVEEDVYAGYGTAGQVRLIGSSSVTPQVILGLTGWANLYAPSNGLLKTDSAFAVVGALTVGGKAAVRGEETLRTVRGTVNADGTIAEGAGFTVTRAGAAYTITFTAAFADVPSIVVSSTNVGRYAVGYPTSTSFVGVELVKRSDGLSQDGQFCFIATGPV